MKAYFLKRDYSHLLDMNYDISLVPFEDSENVKYHLLTSERVNIDQPVKFVANFDILRSKTDYPIVDWDVEVMSKKMINILESVGVLNCHLFSTILINDKFIEEKYDSNGDVLSNVPTLKGYYLIQLLDILKVFDFDNSDFKPLRSNPDFPGVVTKLVLKEPEGGFPPIFRICEKPSSIFVSEEAKEALEKAEIKGVVFDSVEVTPYCDKNKTS